MRVFVTGSSGFIGQHLVEVLVGRGHEVMGVDRVPPEQTTARGSFTQCDIVDARRLGLIVTSFAPDAVAHLAAQTGVEEKADLAVYATNIEGVSNLIQAIRATPSVKRAIFTSTQLVCRVGYRQTSAEDYMPNTRYGESKVEGEKIVRREDGGGVKWCITRPTGVWGPGTSAHYQRFFRMICKGVYFHVGRKPLLKSFGYVGNVAHQYCRLLEVPPDQIHRRTFYVGDFEPLALQAWADKLAEKFGARPIRTIPEGAARVAARFGDLINSVGLRSFPFNSFRLNNVLTEYTFDMTNTREVCGENPYTLDTAAAATAAWFLGKR
jgi:nucleoside-diphosphate-sugar epimerase